MNRWAMFVTAGAAGLLALAGCKKAPDASSSPAQTSATPAVPASPVAPPAGGDWTQVVSVTPEGGYRMGNPNAKVKLVEYGSLTCPHCAAFSQESEPALTTKYVKTGQVSYELRNYLRDAVDLTAVLLARCGGPNAFFPLSNAIWAGQPQWMTHGMNLSAAEKAQLQAATGDQVRPMVAKVYGLDQIAEQRGISADRVNACVNDQAQINSLQKVQDEAQADQIPGTPAFFINGKFVGTATWDTLEPMLKSAVGG